MWYDYLQDYFAQYDYPEEGAQYLLSTMQKIAGSSLWETLSDGVRSYEQGMLQTHEDLSALLTGIRQESINNNVPSESGELLFFLLCMKHLKTLYDHVGLPEKYYRGVTMDLRSKLNECKAVKGIWGSFVAPWFAGFFAMTRFVIGRLQYEMIQMPAYISPDGKYCFQGQPAVNVHIPSGCPLRIEDVQASMAEAAQFFARHFPGKQVLFHCNSWLLFPGHYEMLPPDSGIRRFMDEFTIIHTSTHADRHDLWRLFETMDVEYPNRLPQNTALRREYVRWLLSGKPVGSGVGIRYYPLQ